MSIIISTKQDDGTITLLSITFYVVIYAYDMYGKGVNYTNYKLCNGYGLLEIKSLGDITPDQPKS